MGFHVFDSMDRKLCNACSATENYQSVEWRFFIIVYLGDKKNKENKRQRAAFNLNRQSQTN